MYSVHYDCFKNILMAFSLSPHSDSTFVTFFTLYDIAVCGDYDVKEAIFSYLRFLVCISGGNMS